MSDFLRRPLRRGLSIFAVAVVASALAAPGALARPGDPDPGFGVNGRVVADIVPSWDAYATSMAIDSDGRIVVAGFIARPMEGRPVVARFNADGSLDPSFGGDGVVRPAQWMSTGTINGVAVDGDGRIVLGGHLPSRTVPNSPFPGPGLQLDYDFAVARLLGNGEPDRSFAGDGLLTLDGGVWRDEFGSDLALDGQGRILLSGEIGSRSTVVRVNAAGTPDPSFNNFGVIDPGGPGSGEAIAVDPQGRIVVAGWVLDSESREFAVARLDDSGHLDPGLDEDGIATLDFGGDPTRETATDVALDSDGRIVLVGRAVYSLGEAALVGRLLPDGAPDPSFDGDGRLMIALPGSAGAEGAAIDRAGRIMVVGTRREGEAEDAFLARLGADGALDPSFGAGGVVREGFLAGQFAGGAAVAIDSAGRYLIAGAVWGSEPKGFALARYLSEDQPPVNRARRCRGRRATIVGTGKPDRLRGTRGRDVIVALGGNDRIRAFAGKDLICAGSGRDLVRAGKGNDKVFGGPGRDRLLGGPGKDRLRGGPGRDVERQ